ncbi:redox-regulated ATPase YchF [Blochmannia endosymbiont of Camponotus sp. C-046]|uniref:redox-regulated ATPase YchF n=1 Tax=Blochmannia endosymbiont of Camponotus sp. C-046 TaxID=2945589 RepID=UPI002024A587|nr:redox-regulated ATPase YchF [Blochmannia endosymbiont of Camponotus sp. C-046]URJ28941.1 redox-regulated ATPase YchF [Blochmannia endosymbiont of Camponotus sp. C-046]
MQIDCGIIGLPNVGKSTLFRILTNAPAKIANFPFCTIHPNISVVQIPDSRIYQLMDIVSSNETVHGKIKFVDIAGLIKGAAQGIGMGSKILNYVRSAKVLCHVVRCFDDNQIVHVFNDIDPHRDVGIVNTELILFDIMQCEKSICTLQKKYKFINADVEQQLFVLKKCLDYLYDGVLLRKVCFSKVERTNVEKFNFLTIKPIVYFANIDEKSVTNNIYLNQLIALTSHDAMPLISCRSMLSLLKNRDDCVTTIRKQQTDILYDTVSAIFSVLNLRTFFTINLHMTCAWIYMIGMTALEAANKVHSDFKKGFIRVKIIKFNDFIFYNGELGVKKVGKIYYSGKDYCVEDGDILEFLFKI